MERPDRIPTLADLALQYGTINKKQFSELNRLYTEKTASGHPQDYARLMMGLKYATGYQIGLLQLIREYLIIRKRGEAFGRIAVEKGFAAKEDVDRALAEQKKEFKRAKIKKLIGDILVESGVITLKQKHAVLKEQVFIEDQAERIFSEDTPSFADTTHHSDEAGLTEYESKFLQVKALDQEFAASLVEKKLASEREIKIAQRVQEEAFEKKNRIRILGDIMVELNFLTQDQKNLVLKEQERFDLVAGDVPKGPVEIFISDDRMEAVASIDKPTGAVHLSDVKHALVKKGVQYGVYPDAVLQCNLDMGNTRFIAARQDFSIEMVKQKKATYHFDTTAIDTEEKKKGATLAEQYIGQEAHLKKDIFGRHIEQPHGWEPTFRCGAGTRLSKDNSKAFAGKTGYPSLSIEHKLYVHPTINVLEDADLRYGQLEPYANLTIAGVLTGAYPVTAGNINAREIRGARITAIGNVEARVGITDAVIIAQGDVRARYLHNCRIETFGNVYIENEMIDSQVFCSGKIDSRNCRIISSILYGKKGVVLSGAGSGKTAPCIIGAGTEHHILERINRIESDIREIRAALDDLEEKRNEQIHFSKKTFRKMIELKIFHDRAKKKKETLSADFKKKKNTYKKEKLSNIVKLIHNFEKRKASSLSSLKELNEIKKRYDKETKRIEDKIKKLNPKIEKETKNFQIDITAFFEWARKQESIPQIRIHNEVFQGTVLKGVFSSMTLEKNERNFFIFEKETSENHFELSFQKK